MAVTSNINDLISKLSQRASFFGKKSLEKCMTLIGLKISADTKINIRKKGLIDTGRLINSIKYKIEQKNDKTTLEVGSFGVPYAHVHEFGFRGTVQVQAYTKTSIKGKAYQVRSHNRRMDIKESRFLRDALDKNELFIIDTLRECIGGD